jgi:ABC-type amino acid transport substrate-binding protein
LTFFRAVSRCFCVAIRLTSVVVVVLAVLVPGCQYPRDVEGTLDRVSDGGALRAGVTEHEPYVTFAGERPGGVEVRLLEDFARRLGTRVEYVRDSEESLVQQLREGELDVVAGGISDRSPWKKEAAPTRPYATTHERVADKEVTDRHVMLVRNGENAFLVELERYLLDRSEAIDAELAREGER